MSKYLKHKSTLNIQFLISQLYFAINKLNLEIYLFSRESIYASLMLLFITAKFLRPEKNEIARS